MKKVKCGWCQEYFYADETKNKDGNYKILICKNCGARVNSSIKEPTGNVVGRKHTHRDLKDGDVV